MVDQAAAERACKDPNPVIDGRKANVNLAYIGAKPRNNHQPAQAGQLTNKKIDVMLEQLLAIFFDGFTISFLLEPKALLVGIFRTNEKIDCLKIQNMSLVIYIKREFDRNLRTEPVLKQWVAAKMA